jgi:prefoldin subunit 5
MNKRNVIKGVVGMGVSISVGAVTSNAVKKLNVVGSCPINKVAIGVGAFVLSTVVSDIAVEHFDKKIDDIFDRIDLMKAQMEELHKEMDNAEEAGS